MGWVENRAALLLIAGVEDGESPHPDEGWMAVMSAQSRTHNPLCARRIEAIQKQLRKIYVLRG